MSVYGDRIDFVCLLHLHDPRMWLTALLFSVPQCHELLLTGDKDYKVADLMAHDRHVVYRTHG